jgi:predicted alpha-1,2-mannosidase
VDTHQGTGYAKIIQENREIVGYSDVGTYRPSEGFKGYFVIKFDKPILSYGTWEQGATQHPGSTEITSFNSGAWATFSVQAGETIMVKASISFISIDQARANLNNEIPDWDFNKVKGNAENAWEKELSKIEVEGGTDDERTIFYTALYHSLLLPRVSSEYGKYWSCFDGQVHTVSAGHDEFYNDFSMWDTFRSQHALLILLEPDRVDDMCQSLVDMYKQGGWIPKWPNPWYSSVMIGTHSDSIIAESYLKGITNFDVQKAYEGIIKHANENGDSKYEARAGTGIWYYKMLGYVPAGITFTREGNEGTSWTLELAYDDWCIAQLAKALGRESDYNYYLNRATYYRNVFDNAVGFVRGRYENGEWAGTTGTTFDPRDYAPWMTRPDEGNPWQYTWFVPHDVWGLKQLIDGSKNNPNYPGDFIKKLEDLFKESNEAQLIAENRYPRTPGEIKIGYYWHGNEPGHHISYLFDYAGRPWMTQYWVDNIMKTRYRTSNPYGLPGNDDCGQMSSWYVFSAMGFYPVEPPSLTYEIGRPIFDKVTIHLSNGKDFVIEAQNVSESNMYIQSATLNGRPLVKPWFEHSKLIGGGELTFVMGSSPNTNWGSHPSDAPPSMSGPKFVLENLSIFPLSVIQGENENVTISVNVTNVGTAAGPKMVRLEVDGSIENSKEVTLNPGESQIVSFTIWENELGVHIVYIEDLRGFFAVEGGKFVLENLRIYPQRVYVGENVTISVDVANVGENTGTKFLVLMIENEVAATENVTLGPGENSMVSFIVSENVPGVYGVRIENLTGSFVVETPGGLPIFVLRNLRVNPRRADPGEDITISVDVVNTGDASGENEVTLKVDGLRKDSENVALGPSSSDRVSFTIKMDNLGPHRVEVDGMGDYFWILNSSEAENTKRVEVGDIFAGENKKVDVEGLSITHLVITAINSIYDEEIEILQFIEKPGGVPTAPGVVYKYLSITPSVSRDNDIENVVIGFKVELSWISEKDIDVNTITLHRYDPENGKWEELLTENVGEDEEYAYFEAISPKFSVYAISAKSKAEFPLLVAVIGGGVLAAAIGGYFVLNRRGAFALKRRKRGVNCISVQQGNNIR